MSEIDTLSYIDPSIGRGRNSQACYLVLAMETSRPLALPARYTLQGLARVHIGRGPERSHARTQQTGIEHLRIFVRDSWMSTAHARLELDQGSWFVEDAGSKNGTYVNGVKIKRAGLNDGDVVEAGSTMFLFRDEITAGKGKLADVDLSTIPNADSSFTTLSAELNSQFELLRRIATADVPVLVGGESGTGKEVIARQVHELSGRSGDFIAVNCGALPHNLVESELFGHKRGAFSGAERDRHGLVRAADRGTLFLDEIAELDPPSQVALLRVLQEREVQPIGDTSTYKVNIRVIAATHQDIEARIEDGRFRQDLYARLSGFALELPPLRERLEDLGMLTARLLRRGEAPEELRIHRSAARAMFNYHWPMNIRELEHALNAAVAVCDDNTIEPEHLPEALSEAVAGRTSPSGRVESAEPPGSMKDNLTAALRANGGNVSAAARALGKSRAYIHRLIKRWQINTDDYRS